MKIKKSCPCLLLVNGAAWSKQPASQPVVSVAIAVSSGAIVSLLPALPAALESEPEQSSLNSSSGVFNEIRRRLGRLGQSNIYLSISNWPLPSTLARLARSLSLSLNQYALHTHSASAGCCAPAALSTPPSCQQSAIVCANGVLLPLPLSLALALAALAFCFVANNRGGQLCGGGGGVGGDNKDVDYDDDDNHDRDHDRATLVGLLCANLSTY